MPIYQPSQINTDGLCLLKKQDNGMLYISYESLCAPAVEIQQLENELRRTPQVKAKELFEKIWNEPSLKIIFGRRKSFCDNLWEAWQEDKSVERLRQIFDSPYTDKIRHLRLAILAYRLSLTYDKCTIDKSILAYSHRIIGWFRFPYNIDEDFTAEFFTNFGFGSSSFFTVTLYYKGIPIVPFRLHIEYRFVAKEEIINCSRRYNPQNENWFSAIEFVKESCNLYRLNKLAFINKYLLDECNKLIEGLKKIATQSTFEFIISGYHFVIRKETKSLSGDELLSFRSSKLSSSLDFISHIQELRHIIDIRQIINQIEQLNRNFRPLLQNAIVRLEPILEQKKRQMVGFKILHDELSDEESVYKKEHFRIKNILFEQNMGRLEFIEEAFNDRYPEYKKFEQKYKKNSEHYYELYSEISWTENYIKQFKTDLETIDNYFAGI